MSELSLTENTILSLLAEGPSHGFALSKEVEPGADLGRILTVRRPLVYRALDRLVARGLARPLSEEKGDAGPNRLIHAITPKGREKRDEWLETPVGHVRDIRIELLLKLTMLARSGESARSLLEQQRKQLQPTLIALDTRLPTDHVELWRSHNAAAAAGYLDDLLARVE